MKIATFNVNSIRSRLDIVSAWLQKNKPDILCLQETKVQDKDFPVDFFEDAGYHVVFKGEKSYNGVAIASLQEAEKVSLDFGDDVAPSEARFVYAMIGSVHVINTYVPQGRSIDHEMYQYKIEWFKRLKKYLNRKFSPQMNIVWVGDLNVAPDPIDIHNSEKQAEHVCYHEDVQKAFAETVDWGFVDIFRKYHPEAGQYSFFDYRVPNAMERGMGWRIDHIMATKSMARCSLNAEIDLEPRRQIKPSDHTVMVAEFQL